MDIRLFIARRYFRSRNSRSVINIISGVSLVAVSVPVAAMIILLSVFNGFEQLIRLNGTAFDAENQKNMRNYQNFYKYPLSFLSYIWYTIGVEFYRTDDYHDKVDRSSVPIFATAQKESKLLFCGSMHFVCRICSCASSTFRILRTT